jgi:hypothetical protein
MNYNDYLSATPSERIKMLVDSITEQSKKKKNINILKTSPSEQIQLIASSIKERREHLESINLLTASWTEQVELMVSAIKTKILEKANEQINILTLVLDFLEFGQDHIETELRKKNLSPTDIDNLLDAISPMYKKIQIINEKIKNLKDKISNIDK